MVVRARTGQPGASKVHDHTLRFFCSDIVFRGGGERAVSDVAGGFTAFDAEWPAGTTSTLADERPKITVDAHERSATCEGSHAVARELGGQGMATTSFATRA